MGRDNFIKVWDYYFRGRPSPDSQSFMLSEGMQIGFLSNDMEMILICVGEESNGLYLFRFIGDISG
jgi:hypothetical protein